MSARAPAVALLLLACATAHAAAPVPDPMPAAWVQAFASVPPDPPPVGLIRDTHYVISNEDHPELFRKAVQDAGGVYIGVGSEQNYVLAGWARPQILVLMDFDQVIVDLHRVYRVMFLSAETPAAFLRLWQERNDARVAALLSAAYPDPQVREHAFRAFRMARYAVPDRLGKLRQLQRAAGVRSFLDDPEQYAYLAGLFRAERVVLLRGDLTGSHAVRGIGAAVRMTGLPVRVLYLSNAERYFRYGADFKTGMLALPLDDRSVVLRTSARREGHYEYSVQAGPSFQAWLKRPGVVTVHQLLRRREADQGGAWVINGP